MKLLYLGLNPIQNGKPYRLLNDESDFDYIVAYLKHPDAKFDGKENLNKSAFTHDLTFGYHHTFLKNYSPFKRGNFLSNFHPGVLSLLAKFDVVVMYGHHTLTFILALFWGRFIGKPVVLTTDATYIEGNDESKGWKLKLKPVFLRFLYNTLSSGVFVPSTASKLFLRSIGIKEDRITVTPYVVDEDLIKDVSEKTDKLSLRSKLGLQSDDFIWVFCAKLITRKRAIDSVMALSKISDPKVKLLIIGLGPEEQTLREAVEQFELKDRVVFVGIVKYVELPSYYTASNALVFCSEHEPYGLPVNEAMLCKIPVVISDRIGAGLDLLQEGVTGYSYKCGDPDDLADKMKILISDPENAMKMGQNANLLMEQWSSKTNVEAQFNYFKSKGWWK